MRGFLVSTMATVLWIMTVFDAFSIFMMFRGARKGHARTISILTGILCLGLFYDSLILASGCFLQYGTVFSLLSQLRYILHCTLIPLLFPICTYSLTDNRKIIRTAWVISVIIMILGLVGGILTKTEPRTVGAIRRYASSDLTRKFPSALTTMLDTVPVFIMIGIGIYLWIRKKDPNMFFAGFFMLLFTMFGIFLGKDPGGDRNQSLMFYISMFGEALMVYFLWRFVKRKEQENG